MSNRTRARLIAPLSRDPWPGDDPPSLPPTAPPADGALPLCCGLLDPGRNPGAGYRRASCQRCQCAVAVNARVADGMLDAGLEVELLCLGCWSVSDQAVVRAYRGK